MFILKVGDMVTVVNDRPKQWFGKNYPEILQVKITSIYKNGNFHGKIQHHVCHKIQCWKISDAQRHTQQ